MADIKADLSRLEAEFADYKTEYGEQTEALSQALEEFKTAVAEYNHALARSDYQSADEKAATLKAKVETVSNKQEALDAFALAKINILIINYKLQQNKIEYLREINTWNERRERVKLFTDALQLINSRTNSKEDDSASGKQKGHLYLEPAYVKDEKGNDLIVNGEKVSTIKRTADGKVDLQASEMDGKVNLRALLTKLREEEEKDFKVDLAVLEKGDFDKEDRDKLIGNLNRGLETLNLQQNMSLERMQQLVSERYEAYQFARAIMKPEHEAKVQAARGISGR